MGINAVVEIAKSLQVNNTVEVLLMSNPRIFTLEDEHTIHISEMLAVNRKLIELDLSKHRIRDEGVKWLVGGLKSNHTLKILSLRCNQIGPGGAIHLAEHLANLALVSLDLSGNRLIDQGGKAIAAALKNSKTLKRLDLSYTTLGEESLITLSDTVASSAIGPLNTLMLWGNYFTPKTGTSWRTTLTSPTPLKEYDFASMIQPE